MVRLGAFKFSKLHHQVLAMTCTLFGIGFLTEEEHTCVPFKPSRDESELVGHGDGTGGRKNV